MASQTVEINATPEHANKPLIWRLGKLYNVVTHIRRARVTDDYAYVTLTLEGSTQEVDSATNYLKALHLTPGDPPENYAPPTSEPEKEVPQPNKIYVRVSTVTDSQGKEPLLYRIGKDYEAVVDIEKAVFDEETGGSIEIAISGTLIAVQRSIAYLHTTGLNVNPRQRSVSDGLNL